jgi:hypothetical protein
MIDFWETALPLTQDEFQDLLGVSSELGRAKQDFDNRMTVLCGSSG